MPLACIFTRTWFGPGCGWGTSLICQELLTAGTTAACICFPPRGDWMRTAAELTHDFGASLCPPCISAISAGAPPCLPCLPEFRREPRRAHLRVRGFFIGTLYGAIGRRRPCSSLKSRQPGSPACADVAHAGVAPGTTQFSPVRKHWERVENKTKPRQGRHICAFGGLRISVRCVLNSSFHHESDSHSFLRRPRSHAPRRAAHAGSRRRRSPGARPRRQRQFPRRAKAPR